MLKMGGKGMRDGAVVQMVVIGLSHENLKGLREGRPIILHDAATQFGVDMGGKSVDVIIFSGETEQSMARDFAELMGPETKVNIDPRLRD